MHEIVGAITVVTAFVSLYVLVAYKEIRKEEKDKKKRMQELRFQREKEEYAQAVLVAYQAEELERRRLSVSTSRMIEWE